jgi:hypothetical protein
MLKVSVTKAPMTTEAPENAEEHGRILQFRPRTAPKRGAFGNLARGAAAPDAPPPVPDLRKFSSRDAEPDDFSHRMKMNALVAVVLVVLTGCGMWIIDTMAQVRKNQDCALSGRRNCMVISAPSAGR